MACDEKLTVAQLEEICEQNGIKGYEGKKKAWLVDNCCDGDGEPPATAIPVPESPVEETLETIIKSYKRSGSAPEKEVLECKEIDGGVEIDYAPYDYVDFKYGKRNEIEIRVTNGIIIGKRNNEWVGNCKEMIERADFVTGRTFNVNENIKALGFSWDRDEKLWKRVIPKPETAEKRLDAWKVANLFFGDDECTSLDKTAVVPRLKTAPTIEKSCPLIKKHLVDGNLGNWETYNSARCQLLNDQTGWFINPRFRNNAYDIKVDRSLNYSSKRFDTMWKPYFSSDDEFKTFEKVSDCNGVKALDAFASKLREINS